jgi:hypothetical protein
MILKMIKDSEKRLHEVEERAKLGDAGAAEEVIRLKGASEGSTSVGGAGFEQARAALTQLMSNDSDDGSSSASGGPGTFVAKGDAISGFRSDQDPGRGFGGLGMPGILGGARRRPSLDPESSDYQSSFDPNSPFFDPRNAGYDPNDPDWADKFPHYQGGYPPSTDSDERGDGLNGRDPSHAGPEGGSSFAEQAPQGRHGAGSIFGLGGAANGFNGKVPKEVTNRDMAPPQSPDQSLAEWQERMRRSRADASGETEGAFNENSNLNGNGGFDEPKETDADEDPYSRKKKKEAPLINGDSIRRPKLVPTYKRGSFGQESGGDSLIIRGAQQALDETVIVRDNLEKYQELESSSHCACIIVESQKFKGYLVAALGKNRKIDTTFMDMIKQRLFAFLKAHGEISKEDNSMAIKIQEVPFEDWAMEQAQFLRKSIHDGNEIAMAFFPTQETKINLEESASENMLQMDISELKDDTVVEFDLYIYMPENNKYLLYTPEGRTLHGQQRGRLVEKGVQKMHLRKENAGNVKKYRAQNYLNEKITQFRQAQQLKKA